MSKVSILVTSASKLTPAQTKNLEAVARGRWGKNIGVRFQVDPALIGGLRIAHASQVIDLSLAARLNQLNKTLS